MLINILTSSGMSKREATYLRFVTEGTESCRFMGIGEPSSLNILHFCACFFVRIKQDSHPLPIFRAVVKNFYFNFTNLKKKKLF